MFFYHFQGVVSFTLTIKEFSQIGGELWIFRTGGAEELFGFQARMLLEEGLRMTIEWYRQHSTQKAIGKDVS